MPALPRELFAKYVNEYGLSEYDASVLTDTKDIALFYEQILQGTKNYKAAANWVMGDVKSFINQRALDIKEFPVDALQIAALIDLIDEGKVSTSVASQKIFPELINNPTEKPLAIAERLNVIQDSNEDTLVTYINQVIAGNPGEVERYRNGEKQLVGFFMGQLMKVSQGKADPKQSNQLLRKMLEA